MSLAQIQSFAFVGIEAVGVEVQVQVSSGLPAFLVVGLPDKAVGEARERVRAALTAMGLALPPRRVLIKPCACGFAEGGQSFRLTHRALRAGCYGGAAARRLEWLCRIG